MIRHRTTVLARPAARATLEAKAVKRRLSFMTYLLLQSPDNPAILQSVPGCAAAAELTYIFGMEPFLDAMSQAARSTRHCGWSRTDGVPRAAAERVEQIP